MKVYRFSFLIFLVWLITSCSSLQITTSQKHLSYSLGILDSRYQKNKNLTFKKTDDLIVRVKIYEGKKRPVLIQRNFVFETEKKQTITGKRKFTPAQSGTLKSQNNYFQLGKRIYKGELKIYRNKNSFLYVNHVSMNNYLISVVGHEMQAGWPLAALKAQAVLARTYVLNHMNPQKKYDVLSSVGHQVYGGSVKKEYSLRRAVQETQGEVVIFRKKLAQVFYHSNSGGTTAASHEVWKHGFSYLTSKKSPYAQEAPHYRWQYELSFTRLAQALNEKKIYQIKIINRSQSYRVEKLKYQTDKGWKEITGNDFRKRLGYSNIRSTLFDIRIPNNVLQIAGKGYGHGVGMGQWDAKIMAEKYYYNYRSILNYFFPGTKVKTLVPRFYLPV